MFAAQCEDPGIRSSTHICTGTHGQCLQSYMRVLVSGLRTDVRTDVQTKCSNQWTNVSAAQKINNGHAKMQYIRIWRLRKLLIQYLYNLSTGVIAASPGSLVIVLAPGLPWCQQFQETSSEKIQLATTSYGVIVIIRQLIDLLLSVLAPNASHNPPSPLTDSTSS